MPTPILMPALSPTMEKGKLTKWLVKEGDSVTSGDVIAEIETDKATMEVEAVDEGVVGKIVVSEGTDDVPVNQTIAVLLAEGESASDIDLDAETGPKATAPAPQAQPQSQSANAEKPKEKSVEPKAVSVEPPSTPTKHSGERIFASPLARRIAKQQGIDVAALSGSGPHGRIVKRDVEKAIKEGVPAKAAAAAEPGKAPTTAAAMSDDTIRKLFEEGSYEAVPHDSMRKVIARRLTESKQTIPHFYLSVDCRLDALLKMRESFNARAPKDSDGKPAWKISVNDFVIKALAMALQQVPEANATWTEDAMLLHKHSDVGVAVAIPGGLITPIVRQAETKGLSTISNEMKDFASRARNRKLLPHEYQGGTTAVSNLGMFGIKNFSAVINPPHSTILAVGTGERRAVVEGDEITVQTLMSVTLSTDHRAVDGALGAQLLTAFKNCIEDPAMMLV